MRRRTRRAQPRTATISTRPAPGELWSLSSWLLLLLMVTPPLPPPPPEQPARTRAARRPRATRRRFMQRHRRAGKAPFRPGRADEATHGTTPTSTVQSLRFVGSVVPSSAHDGAVLPRQPEDGVRQRHVRSEEHTSE